MYCGDWTLLQSKNDAVTAAQACRRGNTPSVRWRRTHHHNTTAIVTTVRAALARLISDGSRVGKAWPHSESTFGGRSEWKRYVSHQLGGFTYMNGRLIARHVPRPHPAVRPAPALSPASHRSSTKGARNSIGYSFSAPPIPT